MVSILIVEDDPHQAEVIKLQLIDRGYQIAAVVSDGEAAIEQALKLSPDVVLMDIVLIGEMNGIEAAQRIRESCDIPVLYLTAYDNEEFFRRAKVTEPYAYLLKPSTAREFQLTIEIALYRHKTERSSKEALEKAIKEQTAKLEQAQFIAHIGSWDVDLSINRVTWTTEMYRIYGVSPETFTPNVENLINLIHVDDRPAMHAWIEACTSGKKPKALEFRCVWPDGTIHFIEGQGDMLFDADGKPSHLCGTAQDVTERKKAEDELRIAAAAFDSQEAILITDVNSNIVRVNRAFTDVTGYSPEEVLGKNPRIMQSGRHDKSFYIEMWNQLLRNGTWSGEIYDKRKNGEIYPKWMNITAVFNSQHKPTHYVAIFSDITERKRMEGEIRNHAYYDLLTGLPNRRLFLDRFKTALAASSRRNDHGAILFIDLDRFKVLNDTLGHNYGDLLLIEVGNRIKACVREMDTVARFGGDEFVILIEAISSDRNDTVHKVSLVAEKIRGSLAEPYNLKEHLHCCSPSIGISIFHGQEETMEKLIEHADMAMYEVKNGGRNAVRFFDPIMQKK